RSNTDRNSCKICQKPLKDTDRQNHVGKHLLRALRRVSDPPAKIPVGPTVSATYPCGTCSGSTINGACQIRIKGGKADSDCPHACAFQILAASTFRNTRPCTNIPILCPLNCNEMHWKYNFPRHFAERHPSWRQLIPPDFAENIRVTRAEQLALGIPPEKIIEWLEPKPARGPTLSLATNQSRGTNRQSDVLDKSPQQDQENKDLQQCEPSRSNKTMRLH
ncbi:hypothetical protein FB451DRAFT_1055313, partial [Mycena latifolia]